MSSNITSNKDRGVVGACANEPSAQGQHLAVNGLRALGNTHVRVHIDLPLSHRCLFWLCDSVLRWSFIR